MRILAVLVLSILLVSVSDPASTFSSPMQAHDVPADGAWFEGWYTRVTDPEKGLSFALIAVTARPEGGAPSVDWKSSGYEAVIIQDRNGIAAAQSFPAQTVVTNTRDDFEWTDGKNSVSSASSAMSLGSMQIALRVERTTDWGGAGPEGSLDGLPLPLHWYVGNAGGRASYDVEYISKDGSRQHVRGDGFVHQEKNWGQAFPTSWVWSQAVDRDAYLAVAGGDIGLGPLTTHSYLIGYRSKHLSLDFNAGALAKFKDQINACTKRVTIEASNLNYKLVVDAVGGPNTVSLAIPTVRGYVADGANESFTSQIRTRVYRKHFFSDELIEEHLFTGAALEFGAEAQACRANQLTYSGK